MHLLCIAPYVPHPAIPHAGGAYLHRYLRIAAETEDVVLVAPRTDVNAETVSSVELPYPVHLVDPVPPRFGPVGLRVRNGRAALSPGWAVLTGMRTSAVLAELSATCDVIDVEYGQFLPLVPLLRQHAPAAAIVCTEPDVVAQTFHRRAQSSRGAKRAALTIQQRRIGRREIAYLNACDLVRVTNPKDERLLRSMGLTAPCLVTDIVGGGVPDRPFAFGRAGVVAFTGALWRTENARSLIWFVDSVWPLVRARVPDAEFLAVGADPGPEVLAAGCDDPVLDPRPGRGVRHGRGLRRAAGDGSRGEDEGAGCDALRPAGRGHHHRSGRHRRGSSARVIRRGDRRPAGVRRCRLDAPRGSGSAFRDR
jgi:hypothetical protein